MIAKCCKMRKTDIALQSLGTLYTFVLRAEIRSYHTPMTFGPKMVAISVRNKKNIQNLQTLQGYILAFTTIRNQTLQIY